MKVETGRGEWVAGKRSGLKDAGKGLRPWNEAYLGFGSGTATYVLVTQFPQL